MRSGVRKESSAIMRYETVASLDLRFLKLYGFFFSSTVSHPMIIVGYIFPMLVPLCHGYSIYSDHDEIFDDSVSFHLINVFPHSSNVAFADSHSYDQFGMIRIGVIYLFI